MIKWIKNLWKNICLLLSGNCTVCASTEEQEERKKRNKRKYHVTSPEYIHVINMLRETVHDAIHYLDDTTMNTGEIYYCLKQITLAKKKLEHLEGKIKSELFKKTTGKE